jgi:hypothetical protein
LCKNNSPYFYSSFALAAIFVANLFLFIPFDIYTANNEEFIAPYIEIMRSIAIPAFATLGFLTIFIMLLKDSLLSAFRVLLAVFSILVWLQSDILLWGYGQLDGELIDWSIGNWRGWLDSSIWLITLILSLKYRHKIFGNLQQFVIVVFFIQIIMMAYTVSTSDIKFDKEYLDDNEKVLHEIQRFSLQHNIVHILLDGYQSDIFEDLIEDENIGNKIRSSFDGFVFYRETLGVFPFTRFALPALLSGKLYKNKTSKDDFVNGVFAGKTILNSAHDAGYQVDISSGEYWAPKYALGKLTNSYVIPQNGMGSASEFKWFNSAKILDLALFKSAPHFIKKYIYNQQAWLIQSLISDAKFQFKYFSHTSFLQKIIKNMEVTRTSPVYKYIHVMNTHNPMVVMPDCQFAGGAMATSRPTLLAQSFCTTVTVIAIFDVMKSLGIYDNAMIIIHADHGGWVNLKNRKEQMAGSNSKIHPWTKSLATPLVLIKPPKAKGELKVSPALVSLADLPDTISDIMEWDVSFEHQSILDIDSEAPRQRSFYFYEWQKDAWTAKHTGTIQEYIVNGSHFNSEWKNGQVYNPPTAGEN